MPHVALSQQLAYTPPIVGADGQPLPGSIATMEHVKLGGVDQWLVIRGNSVQNPVLLFLSGGPGGSELGRMRRFNQPLEERFVVAVWEQRGCGKSYDAINPKSALTVDQYVADVIELSDMLRARFHADNIYLMGHSWGSILGVRAVQQRPDLFYFRRDALRFDVPIYFFLGRHDVNATYWLAEDYFNRLQAPHKQLVFFEDSGHGNLWQEPDKFHALMRQVVAETYPAEAVR